MRRFLPLPVFGVLHAYVILSLLSSPAPWGAGGIATYTQTTIVVSCLTGAVLGFMILLSALSDVLRFKTYLIISAIVGIGAIVFSLTTVDPGSTPAVLFQVYGAILILSALTVKIPAARSSASLRTNPAVGNPGLKTGALREDGLRAVAGTQESLRSDDERPVIRDQRL
jgi:hypothetical protein